MEEIGIGKDKYEKRITRIKQKYQENGEELPSREEEKKDGQDQEEETAQEQTEGRERNLMEDRTIMFPDHWWEPRVTTSEGLIKVKMNMGNEVKVNKKEWGSKYPYALFEPLLWFWRTAEWDYSLETVVEEGKERDDRTQ